MPADTLVSTSYTSNQSLSRFLVATLNVLPYQIQPGTVLYLGLYVNGQLAGSQEYDLAGSYQTPAVVIGSVENGVANFSNSTLSFTVSQFPLTKALPTGTEVTVTAWVSNPIWGRVDSTSLAHSYETFTSASYTPASMVVAETGTISPYALSVGLESNAT